MKSRLAALGVAGRRRRGRSIRPRSRSSTTSRPTAVGRILPTKALLLRQIANTLPAPFKFRPAGDLATEIEWAKAQRIAAADYRRELGSHEPPIPADLMARVYREYERRKAERGEIDFEDLLELTVRLHESDAQVRATFRDRYRAFTVDEYQDVNLLQQTLLELWLGDRDDLCVVGDDYQSIYGFTGASPRWLLGVEARFPQADGRPAREQLPLDARGARAREPARAAARRRREGAAPDAAVRARARWSRGSRLPRPRTTGSRPRSSGSRPRGRRLEEMAVLAPHERAPGRLRGGRSTTRASRSRARRCSSATRPGGC